MISFALLGVLQALFLPGLVFILWGTRRTNLSWVEKFLFATPLSITLNYVLISTMVWIDIYQSIYLQGLIVIELAALVGYFWKCSSNNSISDLSPHQITLKSDNSSSLTSLQLITLLLLFAFFVSSLGVFTAWDAVISWNRWAKAWFDQVPVGSWGYPPGLPILYSLVYKSANSTNLQTFSKLVASYFPFFGVFCLWRIGTLNKNYRSIAVIAAFVFVLLVTQAYGYRFIFGGYTDPIMASLGAFSLYVLVLIREAVLKHTPQQHALALPHFLVSSLGALSIAASALIKQPGVLLAALTVLYAAYFCRKIILKHWQYFAGLAVISGIVVVHWYLYSYLMWNDFAHASSLMPQNIWLRVYLAIKMTVSAVTPIIILMMIIGCLIKKEARQLVVFMLPLWLFWALVVSYDFRSAAYIIPIMAFTAGFGIEKSWQWLKDSISWSPRKIVITVFFGVTMVLLILPQLKKASPENIHAINDHLRLQSNEQGFNLKMEKIFAESGAHEKTLSCWLMLYNLPSAEGKFIPIYSCDDAHTAWLKDPEIKYYLYWAYKKNMDVDVVRSSVKRDASIAQIQFEEQKFGKDFILFEKIK